MSFLDRVLDSLNNVGVSAFGISMPVLSKTWTTREGATGDPPLPRFAEDALALELSRDDQLDARWVTPIGGTLRVISNPDQLRTTLVGATRTGIPDDTRNPDGAPLRGAGVLLTVFPQAYLRLQRLYKELLESSSDALVRPVPYYFFYAGSIDESEQSGNVTPGRSLSRRGWLTIYDRYGFPIDPTAVAAIFALIMENHHILQHREPFTDEYRGPTAIQSIAELAAADSVRVWIAHPSGKPYSGDELSGVEALPSGVPGLFVLQDPDDRNPRIARPADQDKLLLGPATNGRLSDAFEPPRLPSETSLRRDFFSIRIIDLESYLLGLDVKNDLSASFNGTRFEHDPVVRLNERIWLLADGNEVLAMSGRALGVEAPDERLSVAQTLDGEFSVPTLSRITPADDVIEVRRRSHWPFFHDRGEPTPLSAGTLPADLREGFEPRAHFIEEASRPNDVVLTLQGLPPHAAVRVYNRLFSAGAREFRGDGAGGVADADGRLTLILRDPFDLVNRRLDDVAVFPRSHPTLMMDVVVVHHSFARESRIYGNVQVEVGEPSPIDSPLASGSNQFNSPERRGISHAAVLGLADRAIPGLEGLPRSTAALFTLFGEPRLDDPSTPRDASRFPTMARRELLVAARADSAWRAVLSGGRLTAESLSADSFLGNPGAPGGRETQLVGVATDGGLLAYDIARAAFRRTTHIVGRMIDLGEDVWAPPSAPDGAEEGSTFAGAVLQTIAPSCETPELGLLKPVLDRLLEDRNPIPANWNELVNWVIERLNDLDLSAIVPGAPPLQNALTSARTRLVNELTRLADSDTGDRLYEELYRELSTSSYGRRDAQWALAGAIRQARRFIYVETPGFCSTRKDYEGDRNPAYAWDMITALRQRLEEVPGLHLILCTPHNPDFAPGFEVLQAYEAADRRRVLHDELGALQDRVVAFHPMGFPGRRSRIEATTIIIDDVWLMVGSSTLRRRGLTFDGGSDVVLTDTQVLDGASPQIAAFRRRILSKRLGISRHVDSELGIMPDASHVRLNDGVESFYLIREMLRAGGLGRIEHLSPGQMPGITPSRIDVANPEGHEFVDELPDGEPDEGPGSSPLLDAVVLTALARAREP
jgi:hypothetical protein